MRAARTKKTRTKKTAATTTRRAIAATGLALAALLTTGTAPLRAQGLTATHPSSVGMRLRHQPPTGAGVVPGAQLIGLLGPTSSGVPGAVGNPARLGDSLLAFTASVHDDPAEMQMAPANPLERGWFTLSPTTSNSHYSPFAAPGCRLVFSDPTFLLRADATFETSWAPIDFHDAGTQEIAVTERYDVWTLALHVPASATALIGEVYTLQAVNVHEPEWVELAELVPNPPNNPPQPTGLWTDPVLTWSDEVVFEIGA